MFYHMDVWKVMLGVVITLVFCARAPENAELFLSSAALEPVIAHVHGFGAFVFSGLVGAAHSSSGVGLDWGRRLNVSEFHESYTGRSGLFGIVKNGGKFGKFGFYG